MPGIAKLYNAVIAQMDDDDDFDDTVYPNDATTGKIIRAVATLGEKSKKMDLPTHQNILRAMVELSYLRVRIGAGDPHLDDLFKAVLDKIANKEKLKNLFGISITAIDDPEKPGIDFKTVGKPLLGLEQAEFDSPPQYSGQREETITFRAWIYSEKYSKQITENVLGD